MGKSEKVHLTGLDTPGHYDLAYALKKSGTNYSLSVEVITDDIKSNLLTSKVLVDKPGWFPEKISRELNAVIIGPNTNSNNPELVKALELKIPVYSLPDYIYNKAINKQRVVVAGTQGKTIISLLLIHVLSYYKRKFDYCISVRPIGKDTAIHLSNAPVIIIEGQELIASKSDNTLSFLKYHHHVGVISDIEAPTETQARKQYISQFSVFETLLPKSGVLFYNEKDPVITGLLKLNQPDVLYIPYAAHASIRENGQEYLVTDKEHFPLKVPGSNALLNINAAREILKKTGIDSGMFYQAIRSFQAPLL